MADCKRIPPAFRRASTGPAAFAAVLWLTLLAFAGPLAAQETLVPFGSSWRYLDDGVDRGTAWREASFDDSAWSAGPAILGYGDSGVEATVLDFGGDAAAKHPTYYFRAAFDVADPSAIEALGLQVRRDDGIVVYLNGTEIFRDNMPAGTISYATLAASAISGSDETSAFPVSPFLITDTSLLVPGTNLLAAEIHQHSTSGSFDIKFDLELEATAPPPAGDDPAILVPFGSTWKYLDDGSNQGTAWRGAGYGDGAWESGPAELGYGDGDEDTVVEFGPNSGSKYITTYFRRVFSVNNPATLSPLSLDLVRDDGAVVYLNGVEVFRTNMPGGTISSTTPASSAVGGAAESTPVSTGIDPALVLPGDNLLAVEIHQSGGSSSDISFDLRLRQTLPILTRGPYLQSSGTDRITLRWLTDAPTASVVQFGSDPAVLDQSAADAALVTDHSVTLTGLSPDTTYYYSVGDSERLFASGPDHFFKTHPLPGTETPTRIWVLGDSGTADANARAVRDAFVAVNGSPDADVLLMLGDNAYNDGTDAEYQAAVFDMYPETLRNTVVWSTLGNHDGHSASSASQTGPYFDIFDLPTAGECGGLASGTEAYYSFDYANIHFVCLDSYDTDRRANQAMATWLANDLAGTAQEWIVAFWHHPPYSKGSHDSDTETALIEMRTHILPILEAHGVDLVLGGHSHSYERSMLIDGHYETSNQFNIGTMAMDAGDGDPLGDGPYLKEAGPNQGAVFAVAGSSGKVSNAPLNHPVMLRNFLTLGSVIIDVEGKVLEMRFIDSNGAVLDTFVIEHQSSAANTPPVLTTNTLAVTEGSTVVLSAVNLSATDAETSDAALVFSVSEVTAGEFQVAGAPVTHFTQAEITSGAVAFVHDGSPAAPTCAVSVSDGELTTGPVAASVTFTPVDDVPILIANRLTVLEGQTVVVTTADLDATDEESADDALTFIISGVVNGGFVLTAAPEIPTAQFTRADIAGGEISFRHEPTAGAPGYFVSVSDGANTTTPVAATVEFIGINDPPAIVNNALAISEGATVVLTSANLDAYDPDNTDAELRYSEVSITAGEFLLAGASALSFTQSDVNSGAVAFVHDGSETAPAYSLVVSDGDLSDGPSPAGVTFVPVNDAPVITSNALVVTEGESVVVTAGDLAATDEETDDAQLEFEITGVAAGEFLVAGVPVAAPLTFTQAELAAGSIVFLHDDSEEAPAYSVSVTDGAVHGEPEKTTGPVPAAITFVPVHDVALTRGPFVQRASATGATIVWRTDQESQSVVQFREDSAPPGETASVSDPASRHDHAVTLEALLPGTVYRYAVGDEQAMLADGPDLWFATHPSSGAAAPLRLWILGNTAEGADAEGPGPGAVAVRDAFVAFNGASTHADAVILLGDAVTPGGTDAEYDSSLFALLGDTMRNSVTWPVRGENESADAAAHESVFVLPSLGESGGEPSGTEAYYAFDIANVHVIVLDSTATDLGPTGAMARWLESDLAGTTQEWIIAAVHHPPYSRGSVDSDIQAPLVEVRENLLPILESGGVDLVVGAHSLAYERSKLIDGHYGPAATFESSMEVDAGSGNPSGDGAYVKQPVANAGAVHVVAGSGAVAAPTAGLDHPAMFAGLDATGSLVLDIDGNQLDAYFLDDTTGVILDAFQIRHEVPPAEVEIVIDNGDPGFSTSGKWFASTSVPGFYGTDYLSDNNNKKGNKSATFVPTIETGGVYSVSMWWPAAASHSANVPVRISHAGGNDTVSVSQRTNGGQWFLLGQYTFPVGADPASGSVTVTAGNTTGVVVVDAVRFTLEGGSGEPDTTPPSAPGGLVAVAGDQSVALDWADNAESDLASYSVYRAAASGGPYALVAGSIAASTFADGSLTNGTPYFYVVTATDVAGNESAYSAEASATPGVAPPGRTVHVDSLGVEVLRQGPWYSGSAAVVIADEGNVPVAGAAVEVRWSFNGKATGTASAVTDGAGAAAFASPRERGRSGDTFTITVLDVSGDGLVYDSPVPPPSASAVVP